MQTAVRAFTHILRPRPVKKPFLASILAMAAVIGVPASAQHGHSNPHHHAHAGSNPYAEMQARAIKALSAEQIDGLSSGKGMGMAMPAELNGYPGPRHVLELASQLGLSEEQRARTQALFEQMASEAKAAGEEVIAAEKALDLLFRDRRATQESVAAAVSSAASAQGRLRETHLRYHLAMMKVLSAEQIDEYNRLRGYR